MDWLTSGYPRTWLRLPTDEPARLLPSDLREALLGMRAVASTGPWLHLRVDGHEVGDRYQPSGGVVTVEVEADAASWIDLSHVLLYQDGVLVRDWSIPSGRRPHPALAETTTLTVSADSWVVAMAVGDQPLPVAVIGAVQGGKARPFAFTNPVWLDFDGDGKLKPPPLTAGPEPFGATAHLQQLAAPAVAAPLHAPLDCEPDVYLDWLQHNPSAR
jgi:hypothetical protein